MESLRLETPEQIAIEYEVARLGSRFIAGLWDQFLLTLALLGFYLLTFVAARFLREVGDFRLDLIVAFAVIASFLITWGYYVLFETVWNGQTPGKRLVSLRTIRQDGYPISFGQSALRNLVRIIDIFPGSYGLGMIVMFFDRQARRLGDIAAGTMVVHDRRAEGIGALRATASRDPALLDPALTGLRAVSREEVEVIRRLLQRRGSLATSEALAAQLAAGLRPRLGPEAAALDDIELLRRVVAQASDPAAPPAVALP